MYDLAAAGEGECVLHAPHEHARHYECVLHVDAHREAVGVVSHIACELNILDCIYVLLKLSKGKMRVHSQYNKV